MKKSFSLGHIILASSLLSLVCAFWVVLEVSHFFAVQLPSVGILKQTFPEVRLTHSSQSAETPQVQVQFRRTPASSWVPISKVSPSGIHAVVISEDWAFFQHKGYDPQQISEALRADFRKKKFVRGASTITQQVVRNVFLDKDKNLWRKLKEVYLAIELEKTVGKKRILEIYLNIAEWGNGIYGIGPAADYYFNKTPDRLTAKEAAFLAMLLPNPKRYDQSFRKKELTRFARNQVRSILVKMVQAQRLSPEDLAKELSEPLVFRNAT